MNLANGDATKLVFKNGKESGSAFNEEPNDAIKTLNKNLKNPYFGIYHWCRGEIADLEAIQASCAQLDAVQARIDKSVAKKKSAQSNLDNVTVGRKSVKTVFKNASDAPKMVAGIEATDKEIESLQIVYGIIQIYLGDQFIPYFKSNKAQVY